MSRFAPVDVSLPYFTSLASARRYSHLAGIERLNGLIWIKAGQKNLRKAEIVRIDFY